MSGRQMYNICLGRQMSNICLGSHMSKLGRASYVQASGVQKLLWASCFWASGVQKWLGRQVSKNEWGVKCPGVKCLGRQVSRPHGYRRQVSKKLIGHQVSVRGRQGSKVIQASDVLASKVYLWAFYVQNSVAMYVRTYLSRHQESGRQEGSTRTLKWIVSSVKYS